MLLLESPSQPPPAAHTPELPKRQHAEDGGMRTGGRPQAPGQDVDNEGPRAQLNCRTLQHPLLALAVRALQHALPAPLLVIAVACRDGLACQSEYP